MVALVILPTFVPKISSAVMGPAPATPQVNVPMNTSTWYNGLDPAAQQYYYNQWKLNDALDTISPTYDFSTRITQAPLYKQSGNTSWLTYPSTPMSVIYEEPSLLDSLAYVWVNILALVIELAVPVAITYVMFMKMDVR